MLLLIAVVLVFSVVYPVTISRKGFEYLDSILMPHEENGGIVYAGKIGDKPASFTVSADNAAVFRYDTQVFGPYTLREDPSAVLPGVSGEGFALYRGEELYFRGYYRSTMQGDITIRNANGGMPYSIVMTSGAGGSEARDPDVLTLVRLLRGPELTHKGTVWGWILGVFCAILAAVSVLFADALFRIGLSFRIDDPDGVEPSDWEMARRTIGWVVSLICTVAVFVWGLQ